MPTQGEEQKQRFRGLCEKLMKNDPSITSINLGDELLGEYGKLDWNDTKQLAAALKQNTRAREMSLWLGQHYISRDGYSPLLFFLGTSTSLRKLDLAAWGESPENDYGATSVLEAVSNNRSVVSLHLHGDVFRRLEMLQDILATTKSLSEFSFSWMNQGSVDSSKMSQALRRGFQQNTSLQTAKLRLGGGPQVREVLFGLQPLRSLRKLDLSFNVTASASEALRCFLGSNETLESLDLYLTCPAESAASAMTTLLIGLAFNRGLKNIQLDGRILNPHIYDTDASECADAWAEMLETNSTLEAFNVVGAGWGSGHFGLDCETAIARGLAKNASLIKLNLDYMLKDGGVHGPSWRDALEKNNTLRELVLSHCKLGSCSDFDSLAQGLGCNKSLKILNLSLTGIDNAQATALVGALRANDVLESLDLSGSDFIGSEGAGFTRGLWCMKNLLHLDLSFNYMGFGGITVFSESLPKNKTLKTLKLRGGRMGSSDVCIVVDSLQGSSALETLNLSDNSLLLSGAVAIALKKLLLSSSLKDLDLSYTEMTVEGVTELAAGLHGNTHLQKLCLPDCNELGNEALVALGEALQVNSTLESLNVKYGAYDNEGRTSFFGLLPRMKGLKMLSITIADPDESVSEAIIDGIRRNTSLEWLVTTGDDDGDEESTATVVELSADVLKRIDFYLKMNRNGRKYLHESKDQNGNITRRADTPHVGAWPRILAKIASPSEQDQLFYFLRRKGDLFQFHYLAPPISRKRKAGDSGVVETAYLSRYSSMIRSTAR